MAVNLPAPDPAQLDAVPGVELGVARAGIRKPDRKDLLLMRLAPGTTVAGVFTRNRFSAGSQDANPRILTSYELYGSSVSIPIPDIDRTDYLLVLGANPSGQISASGPRTRATSAPLPSVLLRLPVMATSAMAICRSGPMRRITSSLSPECDRASTTSFTVPPRAFLIAL